MGGAVSAIGKVFPLSAGVTQLGQAGAGKALGSDAPAEPFVQPQKDSEVKQIELVQKQTEARQEERRKRRGRGRSATILTSTRNPAQTSVQPQEEA